MTLRQLGTLRTLRRSSTLSGAARALGLSQPAVSMQMRDLEREIGVPLFRMRERRLTLTEAGAVLADHADKIVGMVMTARDAARAAHAEGGIVRVGASNTPGVSLLPELVARFRKRHPRLLVRLRVGNTAEVESWVRTGEVDVGVVGGLLSGRGLQVEDWRDDELVLVVAPTHRLAWQRRVSITALADETLLAREAGSATRTTYEAAILAAGLPLPAAQVVGDVEAIKRAVAVGLGVALLSRFSVTAELADGRLVALRLRGLALRRPLRILRSTAGSDSSTVTAFLEALRRGGGRRRLR